MPSPAPPPAPPPPTEPGFPGDDASPAEILAHAHAYREAARLLTPAKGASRAILAPQRLVAIHAVELYLNAYLRAAGHMAKDVRAQGHNLARRADLAHGAGLVLRRRTAAHLAAMTENRDYLAARYAPARPPACLSYNRLEATLKELAEKVAGRLAI